MTTEQPLALRLADDIEAVAKTALDDRSVRYKELNDAAACCAAAAELRRQHAEVKSMRETLKEAGLFLHHAWCDVQMNDYSFEYLNKTMEVVDAALARAGEKT